MNARRMIAIVLTALGLAYPLSLGPVALHHFGRRLEDYVPTTRAEIKFYAPLAFACQVPCIEKLLSLYVALWIRPYTNPDDYPKT